MGQTQTKTNKIHQTTILLESLLKQYQTHCNLRFNHSLESVRVFKKSNKVNDYLSIICTKLPSIDDPKNLQELHYIYNYYTSRTSFNKNQHLLKIYYMDMQDQVNGANIKKKIESICQEDNKKINVNTLCSLNIFAKSCHRTFVKSSNSHYNIKFYQEYCNHNLQNEIKYRKRNAKIFNEYQIWSIISSCTLAAYDMILNGFKQPILSPNAIKIDEKGCIKVSEWEFSHFYENGQIQQQANFQQEGQTLIKQTTSRITIKSKATVVQEYNILKNYYWAPEGIIDIQNATNLGQMTKDDCSKTFSQISSVPISQVFSLGMTVLHMCLMRQLYQTETYSQKKLNGYLTEAIKIRKQYGAPLSDHLIKIIDSMIKWDKRQRINYDQLYNVVKTMTFHSSISSYSHSSTERDSPQNKQITKSFLFIKDDQGSGIIDQGSGDSYIPFEEQNINNFKSVKTIDYAKIDFAIMAERKQWKKFQSRISQNNNKSHKSENTQSKSNMTIANKSRLNIPCDNLCIDYEDQINIQQLSWKINSNTEQIEKIDEYLEKAFLSDMGGLTNIQNSIKLLDVSNLLARGQCLTKKSTYRQCNSIEQKLMLSDIKLQNKPTELPNQNSIFTDSAYRIQYKSISSPTNDNIFTSPELMALIKQSTLNLKSTQNKNLKTTPNALTNINQMPIKHHMETSSNHILHQSIGDQSMFVKESFSKGYYQGSKVNGLRNGYGTFYYNEGGKYCGDWQENQMHGKGTLYYADGRIAYQGEWKNDTLNGKGILYNQNPIQLNNTYDYQSFDQSEQYWVYYDGYFYEDDKSGKGILLLSNGQRFEGEFKNDMIQGRGNFYSINQKKIYGEWKSNKLIKIISEDFW